MYLVEFDVGVHGDVVGLSRSASIAPNNSDEICLEGLMRLDGSSNDWDDLGMPGVVDSGAYDCMGRCGPGCKAAGYSKDCLKHDLCSAYKTAFKQAPASGYCDDPDCGDEGAQAVYTCQWDDGINENPGRRRFTRRRAATCDSCGVRTHGRWTKGRLLVEGDCARFLGCAAGQGLAADDDTLDEDDDKDDQHDNSLLDDSDTKES